MISETKAMPGHDAWQVQVQPTAASSAPTEFRADVLHAIYDRITVARRGIVSVRLPPSAYAHGFALAPPERVVLARPTGLEPATFGSGTQRSIH